jgi:predicted ArsR family transcriptional regulator
LRYGPRVERDDYLALFDAPTMQHDASTAAEALGVDVGTARRHLQALVKTGVLKARAGGWHRSGVWYRLA